jgi:hypothetical protein
MAMKVFETMNAKKAAQLFAGDMAKGNSGSSIAPSGNTVVARDFWAPLAFCAVGPFGIADPDWNDEFRFDDYGKTWEIIKLGNGVFSEKEWNLLFEEVAKFD